ncbi:MAG: hypothetical protein EA378_01475 [Phycisphaerales bacterium]|nr:MAG: hypothetical protein EA378_01475 [Phycisphaerales bacterium]
METECITDDLHKTLSHSFVGTLLNASQAEESALTTLSVDCGMDEFFKHDLPGLVQAAKSGSVKVVLMKIGIHRIIEYNKGHDCVEPAVARVRAQVNTGLASSDIISRCGNDRARVENAHTISLNNHRQPWRDRAGLSESG